MVDSALSLAVKTIAGFEGFRSHPYQDAGYGVWTAGYGQTYDLSGRPITEHSPPMTEAEAQTHLAVLVSNYLSKVREMVHVPITDNQAVALASLCYNTGTAAIRESSLMKALNQGRVHEAADGFRSWIYAGGHPNDGLRARREKERALFLSDAWIPMTEPEPQFTRAAEPNPDAGIPAMEQKQGVTRTVLEADDLNAAELARIRT